MPAKGVFRNSAAFGKRMEYWVIGNMLKQGLDVYIPLVDDDAVDAIIKRKDGSVALVQIKARSKKVAFGAAGLFAAIPHDEVRENYWFVFYSERMEAMWIMTSAEFHEHSHQNKTGKNAGLRSVWLNGKRKNRSTGEREEYCRPQWERYLAKDFTRIGAIAV